MADLAEKSKMGKTTQKGRLLGIATPLGEDFVLLRQMSASEGISQLFTVRVELVREETGKDRFKSTTLEPDSLLGKTVTIRINQSEKEKRFFTGIVNRFSQGTRNKEYSFYYATIVPHVWLLTQNSRSRIFQHKTVPDILAEIFEDFDVSPEFVGEFKQRNFCVQYRESDFDFASRLMEEEGIYYYFVHEEGMDKMILSNSPQSHRDCPNKSEFPYHVEEWTEKIKAKPIRTWHTDHTLQTGKVVLRDYHFQLPTLDFLVEQPSRYDAGGNRTLELTDFPGGYARKYDGIDKAGAEQKSKLDDIYPDRDATAKIMMEALDAQVEVSNGTSLCSPITAGHKFKLQNHPNKDANGAYVITTVEHEAQQSPDYRSDLDLGVAYQNTFTCIPHGGGAPVFRPLRKTPKPVVEGTQTAFVVGDGGQEIFTDKYGRVKVQFNWDPTKENNKDSCCWVRVAKDIAGSKWGTMYIPRAGQEVIVDFLQGDPDQPIIVGSVYNEQTMPHYELPKFKTLTYIKTRTSPDDGKGYNELRFEDKADKEQVFIRSQKRMDVRVRGSLYETCGGNRQEVIGFKQENQPGGNLAVTVAGNHDLHVQTDQFIGIDGKINESVTGDVIESITGKQYTEVTGKRELNASEITLEAMSKITLKVGGSFVSIDLSGVTISGPMVKINSGGAGMGTSPADIESPLDAETSDTGEPGYLEKPRKGGGGGRKKRTLKGQHAPPFATKTLPDGSIQVGNGLVIKPSPTDPNFQQKVLDDLTTMSNYPAGMGTLNSLNNSGQTTNIQHQPTGGNSYSPNNVADALPKGDKGNFAGVGPVTGTGNGTGGTVNYNPDNPRTNAQRPRDVGLHHELAHSDHAANGEYDITHADPGQPNNPHKEETNTIDRDNEYRKERGVHTRKDHTTL